MRTGDFLVVSAVVIVYAVVLAVWLGGLLYRRFWAHQPVRFVGWTAAALVGVLPFALVAPTFLERLQESRVKRTMVDMWTIGKAMTAYATSHNAYPNAKSVDELARVVGPLPLDDGWGRRFRCVSRGGAYVIISLGADGKADPFDPWHYPHEEITDPDRDIVYMSGEFIRCRNYGAEQ